jgi:hypothetical protein
MPESGFTTRPDWFELLAGDSAEIIEEALPRGAHLTRIRTPAPATKALAADKLGLP